MISFFIYNQFFISVYYLGFTSMDWSPIESQWKTKYNLAKEYHNENGNLLIPDKYVTSDGTKLGRWISTQRNYYKKGKLPEDKIDLLEKIDMVWSLKQKYLKNVIN